MKNKVLSLGSGNRVFIGEVIFCIAFAMLLTIRLSNWSVNGGFMMYLGGTFRRILLIGIAVLLAVKGIFFQRMKLGWRAAALIIVALMYLTYYQTGDYTVLALASFIVCGQGVRVRSLSKVYAAIGTAWTLINAILVMAGKIENYVYYRGDTPRYAMGYVNPNTFALIICGICIAWCVITWGKKFYTDFAVIAIGIYFCYFVANSRTFALSLVILAVFIAVQHFIKNRIVIKICVIAMAAIAALVILSSFFFMLFYTEDNALFVKINSALNERPMLANLCYEAYGLNIFGRDYSGLPELWNGYSFLVDNIFCYVLLNFGLVAAVLFIAGLVIFYWDAIRRSEWGICLVGITMFVIIGFTENIGITFEMDYFLIAFSGLIFKEPVDSVKRIS